MIRLRDQRTNHEENAYKLTRYLALAEADCRNLRKVHQSLEKQFWEAKTKGCFDTTSEEQLKEARDKLWNARKKAQGI